MANKNTNINQYLNWIATGYILLGAWVLLLAITDYLSWLGSYHEVFGQTYPPVSVEASFVILLLPIILLAIPLSYFQTKSKNLLTVQQKKFSWIIDFIVIVVLSWFFYFLLRMLFHGLF